MRMKKGKMIVDDEFLQSTTTRRKKKEEEDEEEEEDFIVVAPLPLNKALILRKRMFEVNATVEVIPIRLHQLSPYLTRKEGSRPT